MYLKDFIEESIKRIDQKSQNFLSNKTFLPNFLNKTWFKVAFFAENIKGNFSFENKVLSNCAYVLGDGINFPELRAKMTF